ncbi:histamine H2 receptor-like [Oculina patagonica]
MNSREDSSQIPQEWKELVATYYRVDIASGIFLAAVSITTILGNGLLLLAIWKDPFKTFRSPVTFFVVGLAAADFLTGIAVCPMFAVQYIALYLAFKSRDTSMLQGTFKAAQIGHHISVVTMNSSYFILLLFTWSQFTAIRFPHKHRSLVTKKRVMASVIFTWLYSTAFVLLSLMHGVQDTLFKIDLYFHTTGGLFLLAVAYFSLYKAFRRHMRQLHSLDNNTLAIQQRIRNRRERQFTVVNLVLLTFVIASTVPTTVVSYLSFHWDTKNPLQSLKLQIAVLLTNDVLILKFALDPLIYAWRLAQYRRALKSILCCSRWRSNQTGVSFRRRDLNREVAIVSNWAVQV